MGSPVPLSAAHELRPDARIDILDVHVDVHAVVTCRCEGGKTFLVNAHVPGVCATCRTVYVVRGLRILKLTDGQTEVGVQIGPRQASPIVAPAGVGDVRRN